MQLNLKQWLGLVVVTIFSICAVLFGNTAVAFASEFSDAAPERSLLAYNIDYGMDQARGDQTLEFYGDDETWGEKLRDIIDQTLRNNENHPESKDTAQNSYKRESTLNNLLPEKRDSAFSKKELSDLRATKHPKDILK